MERHTRNWQFALRIRGVTKKTLPLGRLGSYLEEFAGLLGEEVRPTLAGIVDGSLVARASVASSSVQAVMIRVRAAPLDDKSPAGRAYINIAKMLLEDGARAVVEDASREVIVEFAVAANEDVGPEVSVVDAATLDGVVVGIRGADETAHLLLRDVGDLSYRVIVRDMSLARELAKRFRGDPVRLRVQGTWKRDERGRWVPDIVYVDSFEDVETTSARDIFDRLLDLGDTGWDSEDAIARWRDLRGLN